MANHEFTDKWKSGEAFVHQLAFDTFMIDWCYPNPKLPDGKELCDLLVVFDDKAIICQIENLKLKEWIAHNWKDVEKNLSQVAWANRQLFDLKTLIVLENSRRGKETFDPKKINRIINISILLWEEPLMPTSIYEEYKQNRIHVFDEPFSKIIFEELNTISDFVQYLVDEESFFDAIEKERTPLMIWGGEENLLSYYLLNDRSFESLINPKSWKPTMILVDGTLWEHIDSQDWYKQKKKDDEISFVWDNIIDCTHECWPWYEIIAQILAYENRFTRRILSKTYIDAHQFFAKDKEHNINVRYLASQDRSYVFLFTSWFSEQAYKNALQIHCEYAKLQFPQNNKIIWIHADKDPMDNSKYAFCYLEIDEFAEEQKQKIFENRKMTGNIPIWWKREIHEIEYNR